MLAFSVSYDIIIPKLFVKMTYLYSIIHALNDHNAFNSLGGHSSQSNIHSELFSSSIVVFVLGLDVNHAGDAITVSKKLI